MSTLMHSYGLCLDRVTGAVIRWDVAATGQEETLPRVRRLLPVDCLSATTGEPDGPIHPGCRVRRRRPVGLASVRRTNGSYSFPVSRFHRGVLPKVQGRNQCNQFHQPEIPVQPTLRKPLPARITPAPESMRPQAPHDPSVKWVEKSAHMGLAEIQTPPSDNRVDLLDQLPGTDRRFAPGAPTNLVLEVPDRFRPGKVYRSP